MDLDNNYFSKTIRCSSHDRDLDANFTSQSFTLGVPGYSIEFNKMIACQVVSAEIPNVFYNIDKYHTQFKFTTTGDSIAHTVSVPEGQYTITQLMDELISAIDTEIGPANSYSFNDITNKITIIFNQDVQVDSDIDNNAMAYKLGFGMRQTSLSIANVLEAPYIINLTGPNSVYIHSRQLSAGTSDFDKIGDIHSLVRIPLDVNFGQTAYFSSQDSNSHLNRFRNPKGVDEITFNLRDSRGRLLDISDHDWSVVLKIYYEI